MGKGQFDEDEEETERLSVSDAAMIWRSNGEDEDYMFGYSERALRMLPLSQSDLGLGQLIVAG